MTHSAVPHQTFDTVLIANRGEIALRITRTLRRLGIRSVAVYSDADAGARHAREADVAVRLPGGYLDVDGILAAAAATGARAVHPGYGFLAENPAFARRCAEAGLVFVGPPPEAVEAMGDKIRAKATVAAAGVPVVPGGAEPGDDLAEAARRIGFPALIKPSAGGGGKGMVLVRSAAELPDALESARRTAAAAFGDATLLVERFVENPRHIEIQVLADAHGNVIHLGERECSLQRRHQKIIEEAPSPLLDAATRAAMGAAAVEAARSVGYVGAGTVEFIVQGSTADYYFMEMNTRLQVEHPVTELVTGLDLVELQLRVAAGEPLPLTQDEVRLDGHAVEARVYAEDPSRGFLPTGGRVLALREPAGVRVDSGLMAGGTVGSDYDPMLSKIIAWGPDRASALRRLDGALAGTAVLGVPTNVAFLRALVNHPGVVAGDLDTGLVERHLDELVTRDPAPADVLAAAALVLHGEHVPAAPADPWDVPDGWRLGEAAWTVYRLETRDGVAELRVRGLPASGAEVRLPAAGETTEDAPGPDRPGAGTAGERETVRARLSTEGDDLLVTLDGTIRRYAAARDGDTVWLARDGHAWALTRHHLGDPGDRAGAGGSADGVVRSPMPGTVLVVKAAVGDRVSEGQPLLVVEAMKMEHAVTAPVGGVLAELPVRAGQAVAMDAVLAVVRREEA
ncbi:acetyl-CoA/propionyl-CoA carboxylase biotin carboxyl carrier protein [Streptosporangium becharense]|uniref:Biotin-dependent 3-methylcrotonyl-coenzyme A carboxylase alpha1 subunit n=1 Tax=Streptosporangium becharense TaxID=1816182 RepID=A0A7W9MJ28_9ACTN|nr:biotin carboxylase N-terminal domain-containing protein [Streptosporangium becharense]MBB2911542.1 acetyl-CoA/propionyl-CoA carboxylase biotin carboxyl carrier protein [Streptosporangium becharense]MBB5822640.1 acetyl-CoA/propionyl-CoA carboxylase biotin carboxyl carrier protein [Streptosporangium becharense]